MKIFILRPQIRKNSPMQKLKPNAPISCLCFNSHI
ncbi:hypothetical protein [Klebsiella phage GADU21]|nr:hypothetical protein [Klebsiella phage GADU21]